MQYKLLIVDDEPAINDLIAMNLQMVGYEYYQAFEEYEDLPHFMEANPYEDEICPYKQMQMVIKKSFMDDLQRLVDVVNKQKSQPAYKEFLNFLEIEGLENPIDGMVESLSGMMQSDSDV